MKIDADTRLAVILKQNPAALEAIVSIHPHYQKLRNPILRKIMAVRTSIRQAAKVGGCRPEDFFEKLEPLGFEIDRRVGGPAAGVTGKQLPEFVKNIAKENIVTLDARPVLASGKDPFAEIMQKVRTLGDHEALKIINTFEPAPLIAILEKKGMRCFVDVKDEHTVETWFCKTAAWTVGQPADTAPAGEGWEALLEKFNGRLAEIDVRALEMPQPMLTILDALERLEAGRALFVHHKRVPVFLLPELKDRGFDYRIREIDAENVQLLIFKN